MSQGPSSLPETSTGSSTPDDPVTQILLIGRDASGKSSSGNKILGQKRFKIHVQQKSHAAEDEFGFCEGKIGEKQVAVIDCPDLLDPELNQERQEKMKEQLISRCSAGLSSVLLVVPLVKCVQNEEEMLYYIKCLFGPEIQKYIMILFTHEDELEDLDQTIDEYLQNREDLQQLVTECGGKFHCFNNKRKSDDQAQELLQKIEEMRMENGGKFIMERMERRSSTDATAVMYEVPDDIQIPEREDLRLVLLGKTGAGKSAAGNTIIGRKVFASAASSISQTKECQSETTVRFGKNISVIDTPGLYDTELSKEQVITEISKCITYASPGPHAFIIVIRVGRFTEEEKNTINVLKEVFEEIEKYSMILFTHKDQLVKDKTVEQYLQENAQDLKTLISSCGNRLFFLDNESSSFPQFKGLIGEIEKMVAENGGHFTNDMFEKTHNYIREIQKQKLLEKLEQCKKVYKWITQTEWRKIFWRLKDDCQKDVMIQIAAEICIAAALIYVNKKSGGGNKAIKPVISTIEKLAKNKMCVIQ